jgi:BASS family bile acid:Na+ symporter
MKAIDDLLLPASLWVIMLSMGLSLTVADFRRVFENRRGLLVGVGTMLIGPPIIGTIVAILFAPSPALAVGFVLLATTPGGMLSNLMTDLSRGDLALSLSLTIVVSFGYVLLVPFYAHFALLHFMGMSQQIQIPMLEFIGSIFSITILPVTVGLIARARLPALALKAKGYLKIAAMGTLIYAFIGILIDQFATLAKDFGTLFWMVLGTNLAVLLLALTVSRLTRLSSREVSAVGIEHLIRQEGTAIFISVTLVGNHEMSLPMIMNTPIGLLVCIIFVLSMRKYIANHPAPAQRVPA